MTSYHIRQRLTRKGGNQFYRDRNVRQTATFCGAPVTEFDGDWRSKGLVWTHPNHGTMQPCGECLRIRAEDDGERQDALYWAHRPQ